MVFKPKKRKTRLDNYIDSGKKPGKEDISEVLLNQFSVKSVPSHIFQNRSFSILETLVVFLKEKKNLNYREIGILLNRNERTIWTCYHRTKKKHFSDRKPAESVDIPLKIFHDRSISFSEALVKYLKQDLQLSFHQSALLLNRNDRTVWTLFARLQKKQGGAHHE